MPFQEFDVVSLTRQDETISIFQAFFFLFEFLREIRIFNFELCLKVIINFTA